jgi:hypothetical protein
MAIAVTEQASGGADALTVDEFCSRHGISRRLFYDLQKQGRGPRIMKVNSRTLVSREAAAEWRRRVEAQTTQTSG